MKRSQKTIAARRRVRAYQRAQVGLVPGARVVLRANKKEGWPRETATVLEDRPFPARLTPSTVIAVIVDRPCDETDDQIREVTLDQIARVIPNRKVM